MAHKKGQGSSRNGRDSNPQMLGIKLFGGQEAKPGSIICRQKGTRWRPGKNVGVGRDWTIFSLIEGRVAFDQGGTANQCHAPRHGRAFGQELNCSARTRWGGRTRRAERSDRSTPGSRGLPLPFRGSRGFFIRWRSSRMMRWSCGVVEIAPRISFEEPVHIPAA